MVLYNVTPDRIPTSQCCPINELWIYHLTCILATPPRIPSGHFAFYGTDSPLSAPAHRLQMCYAVLELFSNCCLFWNTWFNFLSGMFYRLNCCLESILHRGASYTVILHSNIHTTPRNYNTVGLGWVAVIYLQIDTLPLFYRLIYHYEVWVVPTLLYFICLYCHQWIVLLA